MVGLVRLPKLNCETQVTRYQDTVEDSGVANWTTCEDQYGSAWISIGECSSESPLTAQYPAMVTFYRDMFGNEPWLESDARAECESDQYNGTWTTN